MAERVGFEPTVPQSDTTVFETVPFNHSGTSPSWLAGDVNAAGAQGGYHGAATVVQAPAAATTSSCGRACQLALGDPACLATP